MNKLFSGVAIGALGFALIGGIDINVTPNVNYHTLLKPQIVTTESYRILGTVYNINLGDELEGSEAIQTVLTTIQSAGRYDKIIFHIKGYGGSVDGLLSIINAVHRTEANVVMSVEGPAYSAYAVLATQGDELIIDDAAFLMFHTTSLVNLHCSQQTGIDRGDTNEKHCQQYYDANLAVWQTVLGKIKYLTKDEKSKISLGQDVYLMSYQVKERVKNGNASSPTQDMKALGEFHSAEELALYFAIVQGLVKLGVISP